MNKYTGKNGNLVLTEECQKINILKIMKLEICHLATNIIIIQRLRINEF